MKCCVPGCRSRTEIVSSEVSFHRFPNDPAARKRWTDALQRSDNWLPTKWSVVCSLHFRAEDFKAATGNLRRLTASAVPSLSLASATHTGEASTAAAATASEQEVPHEKDIIQTSLQPSNESVQHLCDAGSAAEIAGPSQSDSQGTTTAPPLAEQHSVSPEEMAAEELKEQEVEVLMEWETDSSGTISAEEEMPIPVSPPMRKKPCHRQLPFDRNQSDREAAVAGLRQGTGNAQATARPSLQARRVAVMVRRLLDITCIHSKQQLEESGTPVIPV
ncbi:uncharacterized protein LOC144135444 isoform X1 [Amblyomma americanum]